MAASGGKSPPADGEKRRRRAGQQLDLFGNVNHMAWQAPEGPEDVGLYIAAGEVAVPEGALARLPATSPSQVL